MRCKDCNGSNVVSSTSIHDNPLFLCKDCKEFFYGN